MVRNLGLNGDIGDGFSGFSIFLNFYEVNKNKSSPKCILHKDAYTFAYRYERAS